MEYCLGNLKNTFSVVKVFYCAAFEEYSVLFSVFDCSFCLQKAGEGVPKRAGCATGDSGKEVATEPPVPKGAEIKQTG